MQQPLVRRAASWCCRAAAGLGPGQCAHRHSLSSLHSTQRPASSIQRPGLALCQGLGFGVCVVCQLTKMLR